MLRQPIDALDTAMTLLPTLGVKRDRSPPTFASYLQLIGNLCLRPYQALQTRRQDAGHMEAKVKIDGWHIIAVADLREV